jgi:Transposase IS66 family
MLSQGDLSHRVERYTANCESESDRMHKVSFSRDPAWRSFTVQPVPPCSRKLRIACHLYWQGRAASLRRPAAAGDAGLDPEPTWALRRLFLGPAEQPLQPEEPLLEELVAHVSHRQRGRRSQGGLQADAYSGYNELYDPARPQGPITAAFCWAHARRQFFELADIAANARRGKKATAIIALEAVKRIDALFDIERGISGQSAEERQRVRLEQSAPLLAALEAWLREQRSRLSRSSSVAEPIDYMLRRWDRFTRFINDGRICLTNNAAERALGSSRSTRPAGGLILAAITHVFIITYVAEMLGEDEDWLANYRSTCSQSTVACMSTAARMMRMMR